MTSCPNAQWKLWGHLQRDPHSHVQSCSNCGKPILLTLKTQSDQTDPSSLVRRHPKCASCGGKDAFTKNNRICFFVLVFTIYASDLFFRISIEGHTNSERIHNLGTPLLCSIQLFIFISFTSHTVNMTQNMGPHAL